MILELNPQSTVRTEGGGGWETGEEGERQNPEGPLKRCERGLRGAQG